MFLFKPFFLALPSKSSWLWFLLSLPSLFTSPLYLPCPVMLLAGAFTLAKHLTILFYAYLSLIYLPSNKFANFPFPSFSMSYMPLGSCLFPCAVCPWVGPQIEQPIIKVIRMLYSIVTDIMHTYCICSLWIDIYLVFFLHINKSYILVVAGWPPIPPSLITLQLFITTINLNMSTVLTSQSRHLTYLLH